MNSIVIGSAPLELLTECVHARGLLRRGRGGLRGLPPGETFRPFDVGSTHLGFDEYDVARQGLVSHHYWIDDGKVEVFSPPFRYVWPSELDLMARLAGLTLRERWSGWEREPFTSDSTKHVSVWKKAASSSSR